MKSTHEYRAAFAAIHGEDLAAKAEQAFTAIDAIGKALSKTHPGILPQVNAMLKRIHSDFTNVELNSALCASPQYLIAALAIAGETLVSYINQQVDHHDRS